jgi:hypothetical protein
MKTPNIPRDLRGSGYLEVKNTSTIASNGVFTFTLDERFKPYNELILINTSINDCLFSINWGNPHFCPRGNSSQVTIPTENVSVTNKGSTTIAIDELTILYKKNAENPYNKLAGGLSMIGQLQTLRGLIR